jgi:hypothetical protein
MLPPSLNPPSPALLLTPHRDGGVVSTTVERLRSLRSFLCLTTAAKAVFSAGVLGRVGCSPALGFALVFSLLWKVKTANDC